MFSRLFCRWRNTLSGLMCCIATVGYAQQSEISVVTESSPPFQIMENGEVAGSATDKVRALLRRAGLHASFSMYPWARAFNKALKEPDTLIYSIARSEKRDENFIWLLAVTEYQFGLVALTEREDIKFNSLSDIKQFRLAVQREDISHEWLLKQGLVEGQQFITCADIDCSWQLLLNKNVDMIIETPDLIEDMLSQFHQSAGSARLVMSIPELAITGYLAANKNIDPVLLAKLKAAIAGQ